MPESRPDTRARFWRWLGHWLPWWRTAEAEFDDEIESHLEHRIQEWRAAGLSPADARAAAQRQFGNVEHVKAAWRGMRRASRREELLRDVRGGVRVLARHPGFAVAATLTLALGVGANVAVFSAVRSVLLDEPPYPEADRLVEVTEVVERMVPHGLTLDWLDAVRQGTSALAGVAGRTTTTRTARGNGDAARVSVAQVTESFFPVFGVSPTIGRPLGPADFASDARPAVISASLWHSQFGGRPDVVGSTIRLDGGLWTVVGVMPDTFAGDRDGVAVWVALRDTRPGSLVSTFARLAPDATLDEAEAQVNAILQPRQRELGDIELVGGLRLRRLGARVEVLGTHEAGLAAPGLLLLQGVAAFLLLITCANLANMCLAHATARRREFALRAALGAGRGRLTRQVLTEAGLIAVAGGTIGLAAAAWVAPALISTDASILPHSIVVTVRWPDFAVGFGLAAVTTLLFALLPARLAASSNPLQTIRELPAARNGRRAGFIRGTIVAVQVVLALVVLAGAGLLLRSFAALVSVPLGFDPRGLAVVEFALPPATVAAGGEEWRRFADRTADAARDRLGAEGLALASEVPFGFSGSSSTAWMVGDDPFEFDRSSMASIVHVSPSFFDVLRIPLARGRLFEPGDDAGSRSAAIVNEAFVRQFGKGGDLLGVTLSTERTPFTIVGIVGDVRNAFRSARPAVYTSLAQDPATRLAIVLRTPTSGAAIEDLRSVVRALDPDVPLTGAGTLDAGVARRDARRRFYLSMLSLFAGLAGSLAVIGIYGVAAHEAGLRRHEMGIRLALGASLPRVTRHLIADGLKPVALGLACGVAAAWWVTRALEANTLFSSQLFQVTPHDPLTYVAVSTMLLASGLLEDRKH